MRQLVQINEISAKTCFESGRIVYGFPSNIEPDLNHTYKLTLKNDQQWFWSKSLFQNYNEMFCVRNGQKLSFYVVVQEVLLSWSGGNRIVFKDAETKLPLKGIPSFSIQSAASYARKNYLHILNPLLLEPTLRKHFNIA